MQGSVRKQNFGVIQVTGDVAVSQVARTRVTTRLALRCARDSPGHNETAEPPPVNCTKLIQLSEAKVHSKIQLFGGKMQVRENFKHLSSLCIIRP